MTHNPTIENYRLQLLEDDRSERTVRAYVDDLSAFATWYYQTNGEPLTGENLTSTDLREYRGYLQHPARDGYTRYSQATINRKLAALRSFAAWCKLPVVVRGVTEQPAAPRWLDRREVARITRYLELTINGARTKAGKRLATRNRSAVILMSNTGLRVSELCNLNLSDLEISERKGQILVIGKGDKTRTIPLNLTARWAIRSWLDLRGDDPGSLFDLQPRQVQRSLETVSRAANVECTPHTLRHTFAHDLICAGVSIERVAALLGHTNLETTRLYIIPGQQDLQQAVDCLSE